MGLFGKPKMPPISDEPGVVDWFLKHDDLLKDIRKKFSSQEMWALTQDHLLDLKNFPDGDSLSQHLQDLSRKYDKILPLAAEVHKRGGASSDDQREIFAKVLLNEAILASKLRILGYILKTKYGIEPPSTEK